MSRPGKGAHGRWRLGVVATGLFLMAGCSPRRDAEGTVAGALLPQSRNLDILFMVDNSTSMAPLQEDLIAAFPTLLSTLDALPGGSPGLHVAVVSSDMGAGGGGTISTCGIAGGDAGNFRAIPRGTCTATTLQAGAQFISNVDGVANYTAPRMADVFACIAPLGENGCAFEHQLASVARALGADGSPAPASNGGFLRPDALLAVVMVSNEDDCSERAAGFFDEASNIHVADPLGPLLSFRCNEFGHLCGSPPAPPPRNAPGCDLAATRNLDDCKSAEGSGMLKPVSDFATQIKALKNNDGSRLLVAVIAGPRAPYQVHWRRPDVTDDDPWPSMTHACTAAGGRYGDPAVRLADWAQALGSSGLFMSICDDMVPSLQKVGQEIGKRLPPADGGVADADGDGDGDGDGSAGGGGGGGGGAGGSGATGASGGPAGGGTTGGGGAAGSAGRGGTKGPVCTGTAGRGGTGGSAGGGGAGAGGSGGTAGGGGGTTTGGGGSGGAAGSGVGGAAGTDGSDAGSGGAGQGTGGATGGAGTGGITGAGGRDGATGGRDAAADHTPGSSGSGCGCSAAGPAGDRSVLGLLALVLVVARRRQRT